METLKTVIISLLLIILIWSLLAFQIGIAINMTLLNPDFYDDVLQGQDFYIQLRQFILRTISRNLPNSHNGLPYLRDAISEEWLREEITLLINDAFDFFKGDKDLLPVIPFFKMKDRVAGFIVGEFLQAEKESMTWFWFEPLPDIVRLQDFMGVDLLWQLRSLISVISRIPLLAAILFCISAAFIFAITVDWREMLVCAGSAGIASGILVVGFAFALRWIMVNSSIVAEFIDTMVYFEFPRGSVEELLRSFIKDITIPMNISGVITALAGLIILYFTPLKDKKLTLIK